MTSKNRLTAGLRCKCNRRSVGLWSLRHPALRQACVVHARRELRHHRKPFGAVHPVPARDLRKRASAAEAEAGSGIDHADCDTRRFFAHSAIVMRIRSLAQALEYIPVPAVMIALLRGLRLSSDLRGLLA